MNKDVKIWIDAFDFASRGGWKMDTQFVHLMGSGYLIAADEPGVPVEDATVTVNVCHSGKYRIYSTPVHRKNTFPIPVHHPL